MISRKTSGSAAPSFWTTSPTSSLSTAYICKPSGFISTIVFT